MTQMVPTRSHAEIVKAGPVTYTSDPSLRPGFSLSQKSLSDSKSSCGSLSVTGYSAWPVTPAASA